MAPSTLLYQRQSSPLHSDTTVSQQCHFDVNDTTGHFMVSAPPQISITNYHIDRNGLAIDKPKRLEMPFALVRQINWLSKNKHMGVITEKEEYTEWLVYDMSQEYQFTPYNLKHTRKEIDTREFVCNGDIVGLLVGSEVILIELTRFGTVARWPLWSGSCQLLPWKTGFIALGAELAVWAEGKSKGYGVLESEGSTLFENTSLNALTRIGDSALGVATSSGELTLLRLGEDSWQLWFREEFTSSVFSLHPTHQPNTVVAVMDSSTEESKVVLL